MYCFLIEFIQFLIIIPAALLCYIPMKNQIKYSKAKLTVVVLIYSVVVSCLCAACIVYFDIALTLVQLVVITVSYILYSTTVMVDRGRSLAAFLVVVIFMTFSSTFSVSIDAWFHPTESLDNSCMMASLVQLGIAVLFLIVLALPFSKYFSKLIDELQGFKVWYAVAFIPFIFTVVNSYALPRKYETLYVNRVFSIYITAQIAEVFFLFFCCIIFYYIAMEMLEHTEKDKRLHFFEMQERQYIKQQEYLDETSRIRHDFRQSICTLKGMLDEKNYTAANDYLSKFFDELPRKDTTNFCKNQAINALLNYYEDKGKNNNIELTWNLDIPNELNFSEIDLCNILGNILENSFDGCMTLTEGKRFHKMSITFIHNVNLYIVSENSFDGKVKLNDGRYMSTKIGEHGMGLNSIRMTADKYHGKAAFRNTEGVFFMDVVLEGQN